MLAFVYATPLFFVLRMDQVTDTDIWWHLRIGEWIAQHRAIPHTELFSTSAAGQPWAAYSWLFEVLTYGLFHKFGLVGIVLYTSGAVVAIAAAVHHLLRRLNSDFTFGVLLTFFAMCTMARDYTPRPWLLTILFFTLELDILFHARKTGNVREFLWLPPIFALWTNIHIQFVDGLILLGMASLEPVLAKRWPAFQTKLSIKKMAGISVACLLATLVNPYGAGIYKVAYDLVTQAASLDQIIELSAIPFRHVDDWCLLFVALAGVFVLARVKRPGFFETALLAFSILVSFRMQRDVWVLTIAGCAIVISSLARRDGDTVQVRVSEIPLVCIATAGFCAVAFLIMGVSNGRLQAKLENNLPMQAVNAIRKQSWDGPIFNTYNWGGFLIWTMHRPVSMYGRNTDYGVEKVLRTMATWNGQDGWDSDPDLVGTNLVIAPAEQPLVQLLRLQPCLEQAYADNIAVIFIPRKQRGDGPQTSETSFCRAREERRNGS